MRVRVRVRVRIWKMKSDGRKRVFISRVLFFNIIYMGRFGSGGPDLGFFFFLIHIQSYYLSDQVKSGQAEYPRVGFLLPSLLSMLLATYLELYKLLPITPKTWLH